MKKLILTFGISLVSVMTTAGEQTGKITEVRVRASDGLHWFYMEGTTVDPAACAGENGRWMIQDENSLAGKSLFSMVLTAYASGRNVSVKGTGTCTRWSSGEDVAHLFLQ